MGRGFEAFDTALDTALRQAGVGLVCLAGFMRLLTARFSQGWHDRLINIHPSLLPSFKGLDSHAQALAAGVRFSGCTVHFVDTGTDTGPIVAQTAVPVLDGDTVDSLMPMSSATSRRINGLRWSTPWSRKSF